MHKITYTTYDAVIDHDNNATTTATLSAPDASVGTTIYNALVNDLLAKGSLVSIEMADAKGERVMGWDRAGLE